MIEFEVAPPAETLPKRDIKMSMLRGWRQKCPACGKGALYGKYLKVLDTCPACGEELFHQRADDAPPYFTMVVVGHVVIGGVLVLEKAFAPPSWVHLALWMPLTVALSLVLLPRVKGTLIGLQWALRMHGFGGATDDPVPDPSAH
ncbi:DUF983 domain-containing protein [uncultured Hyphomicrobium sp.]|uniref:DUF983 domain-containing protein n=1 Tax=uncultured Hyphomicrobium sp. TaxID=194373 RepID=UPI0025DF8202|nr:DUF983 domain-containing protein [uncultured Hyphomicrobium sp.]